MKAAGTDNTYMNAWTDTTNEITILTTYVISIQMNFSCSRKTKPKQKIHEEQDTNLFLSLSE